MRGWHTCSSGQRASEGTNVMVAESVVLRAEGMEVKRGCCHSTALFLCACFLPTLHSTSIVGLGECLRQLCHLSGGVCVLYCCLPPPSDLGWPCLLITSPLLQRRPTTSAPSRLQYQPQHHIPTWCLPTGGVAPRCGGGGWVWTCGDGGWVCICEGGLEMK